MRILYVTTISSTMVFFIEHIKMLMAEGHTVDLACNLDEGVLPEYYKNHGFALYNIPFSRSPLNKSNAAAYKQLKKLIEEGNYDIVHTHTPNASAIVRLACRKLRKKGLKVFYTAHGFHFYKGAPLKNWLLYYPVEKMCSKWTDTLITINYEDYERAKNKLLSKETIYIPGVGLETSKFKHISDAERKKKRMELNIPDNMIWVLAVGELIVRKNHEILIKAIADIPNIYLTIAGNGILYSHLQQLIDSLQVGNRVKLLGLRSDISELSPSADVFSLPSFQEGLSVALMEAMSCGIPCVVSNIRGNVDLIDENGGTFFNPHSVEECKNAFLQVMKCNFAELGAYNINKVKGFDTGIVIDDIKVAYSIQ